MTSNSLFPEIELRNALRNKLDPSDRAFHDWYRFVLSYPPHLVRQYLSEFNLQAGDLVLDPFCGTGTTVLEAKLQGISSVGVEANRFAHFASSTKVDWNTDTEQLIAIAAEIKEKALAALAERGISDLPSTSNLSVEKLLVLGPEKEGLILKNSISPLPLHKALVLLTLINEQKGEPYNKYLRLAFAYAAVYKFSNLRFGPEVGVGKKKDDAPVISEWFQQLRTMVKDLELYRSAANDVPTEVILNDARNLGTVLKGKQIAAVITSPPYPNEKDYTRTTRLESVLLDFIHDKEDLRNLKKGLLRSNTRGVYKADTDDEYVADFPEIQRIADEIEARRIELGKTSGFEKMYARVTKLYFGGMARHLAELREFLKPGAQLAYVVGDQASYLQVMIRTGNLLAQIAEKLGYEVVRIDLFRTRFSTATKMQLNEEAVILRWNG